jgi:hypothetical protein
MDLISYYSCHIRALLLIENQTINEGCQAPAIFELARKECVLNSGIFISIIIHIISPI